MRAASRMDTGGDARPCVDVSRPHNRRSDATHPDWPARPRRVPAHRRNHPRCRRRRRQEEGGNDPRLRKEAGRPHAHGRRRGKLQARRAGGAMERRRAAGTGRNSGTGGRAGRGRCGRIRRADGSGRADGSDRAGWSDRTGGIDRTGGSNRSDGRPRKCGACRPGGAARSAGRDRPPGTGGSARACRHGNRFAGGPERRRVPRRHPERHCRPFIRHLGPRGHHMRGRRRWRRRRVPGRSR